MPLGISNKKDRPTGQSFHSFELSYLDSNQDKQNQNLLCYHYTIGQSSCASFRKSGAKLVFFIYSCKLFAEFLQKRLKTSCPNLTLR